jgi:hypothetical protein
MALPEPPATPEIGRFLYDQAVGTRKGIRVLSSYRLLLNHVVRTYGTDGLVAVPPETIRAEWLRRGGAGAHHMYVMEALVAYRAWHECRFGSFATEDAVDEGVEEIVDRLHDRWHPPTTRMWARIRNMYDRTEPALQHRFDALVAAYCPDVAALLADTRAPQLAAGDGVVDRRYGSRIAGRAR